MELDRLRQRVKENDNQSVIQRQIRSREIQSKKESARNKDRGGDWMSQGKVQLRMRVKRVKQRKRKNE